MNRRGSVAHDVAVGASATHKRIPLTAATLLPILGRVAAGVGVLVSIETLSASCRIAFVSRPRIAAGDFW